MTSRRREQVVLFYFIEQYISISIFISVFSAFEQSFRCYRLLGHSVRVGSFKSAFPELIVSSTDAVRDISS